MESRVKETIVRHDKGYNCAQAVACTYCDLFGYKEEDVFRMTEGFGLCAELKGVTTGTPVHSCADCIKDAAAIVEEVLLGGENE